MRILITGASGLLGGNLIQLLPETWEIVGVVNQHMIKPSGDHVKIIRADLSTGDVSDILKPHEPFDAIINTAALTNVDLCEKEHELAYELNAIVPQKLAQICKANDIHLVHISTDQVFDGEQGNYDEESPTNPVNQYAKTKLAAEQLIQEVDCKHTIIRTNLFGFDVQNKNDFAGWILGALKKGESLTMCTDIIFSIILVNDLIKCIEEIIEKDITGILNIGASDSCSKYEFSMRLAKIFDLDTSSITPILLKDLGLKAPRPKHMALNTKKAQKLLSTHLPTIDESMAEYKRLFDEKYHAQLKKMFSD